jgi:hypothetical protein
MESKRLLAENHSPTLAGKRKAPWVTTRCRPRYLMGLKSLLPGQKRPARLSVLLRPQGLSRTPEKKGRGKIKVSDGKTRSLKMDLTTREVPLILRLMQLWLLDDQEVISKCRSIKALFNFEPAATNEEIKESQFSSLGNSADSQAIKG